LDVPNGSGDGVSVDVHVEDVHEKRDAKRTITDEGRLVELSDVHNLAVRGRYDEMPPPLTGPLGVAEKVSHPQSDQRHGQCEKPERPRSAGHSERKHAGGEKRRDDDEREAFAREIHDCSVTSRRLPVMRSYAFR
jgi:hypothetical protein